MERPAETTKTRYLERVKELDLEDLEYRQELAESWDSRTRRTVWAG